MADTVRDNPARHRFELDSGGQVAFLTYRLAPGSITLLHEEVPSELEGRGIGSALARGVLEMVRARGLKLVVLCPFVESYMEKHPEFNDLLRKS
jgi:uncharacterized protein